MKNAGHPTNIYGSAYPKRTILFHPKAKLFGNGFIWQTPQL
jgi:hypothetical protein